MIKILLSTVVFTVALFANTFAQTVAEMYPAEGVYATFSAFRNGLPDVTKQQFIKSETTEDYTIRQWVNSDHLYYYDSTHTKQSYNPRKFWGFVEKGTVYIFLGNKFHKINTLGQISYFLESYPIIKGNMSPVVTEAHSTSAYRFLDMETGEILDYTVENLMDLIVLDETLSLEYKSIVSQKEKKKKMFSYMERFNSNHPLRREAL